MIYSFHVDRTCYSKHRKIAVHFRIYMYRILISAFHYHNINRRGEGVAKQRKDDVAVFSWPWKSWMKFDSFSSHILHYNDDVFSRCYSPFVWHNYITIDTFRTITTHARHENQMVKTNRTSLLWLGKHNSNYLITKLYHFSNTHKSQGRRRISTHWLSSAEMEIEMAVP